MRKLTYLICALLLALPLILVSCGCTEQGEDAVDTAFEESAPPTEEIAVPPSETTDELPAPELPEPVPHTKSQPRKLQVLAQPETAPIPPEPYELVRVSDYIPGIAVDLRYATTENFTGVVIYDFEDAYLRYGTVEKLMRVQTALEEQGLGLKIWDAFRPVSAQFVLWETVPDSRYVANPNSGYSSHSRGNTVDITLVDSDGNELEMPTGFDDFSALADRDYRDASADAAENARILEQVMKQHGFKGYSAEWWHYTDTTAYEVEKVFDPGAVD